MDNCGVSDGTLPLLADPPINVHCQYIFTLMKCANFTAPIKTCFISGAKFNPFTHIPVPPISIPSKPTVLQVQ
jgi:hypothetical protein